MSKRQHISRAGRASLFCLFGLLLAGMVVAESEVRGLVIPDREATLSAQVDGKIEKMEVRLGEKIKQGQTLVRFDCRRAKAQLEVAQAELAMAEAELKAQRDLQEYNVASAIELTRAENAVDLRKAQFKIASAGHEDCYIKAPFNGWVADILVKEAENVGRATPLIRVASSKSLWFEALVPVEWIADIQSRELKLKVDVLNSTYPVKVKDVAGYVDPVTRTVKVRGEVLGERGTLRPGLSGVLQK